MHIHTLANRSLTRVRHLPAVDQLRSRPDSALDLLAAALMLLSFMAAAILV